MVIDGMVFMIIDSMTHTVIDRMALTVMDVRTRAVMDLMTCTYTFIPCYAYIIMTPKSNIPKLVFICT